MPVHRMKPQSAVGGSVTYSPGRMDRKSFFLLGYTYSLSLLSPILQRPLRPPLIQAGSAFALDPAYNFCLDGPLPHPNTSISFRQPIYPYNLVLLPPHMPYRNAHYPPHSHSGVTTHLIRRGALTITYPRDERPKKETFGVGARIDVPAEKEHEVWMGEEGCEYVIGE